MSEHGHRLMCMTLSEDQRDESYEAYIQRVVSEAPPFTDEQMERLLYLFSQPLPEHAK